MPQPNLGFPWMLQGLNVSFTASQLPLASQLALSPGVRFSWAHGEAVSDTNL